MQVRNFKSYHREQGAKSENTKPPYRRPNLDKMNRLVSRHLSARIGRIGAIQPAISLAPLRAFSTFPRLRQEQQPPVAEDSFIDEEIKGATPKRQRVRPTRMKPFVDSEAAMFARNTSVSDITLVPETVDLTALEKQDIYMKSQRKITKAAVKFKTMTPISPSMRWYKAAIYPYLWKGKPHRALTVARKARNGRCSNTGRVVTRHQGGGHRRRVRLIDFFRQETGECEVVRIERDPNRSGHIALLKNKESGNFSYITAPEGTRAGDTVQSFLNGIPQNIIDEFHGQTDPAMLAYRLCRKGNCLPMWMIPVGTVIHAISTEPHGKAKFCRAAGTYGRLIGKEPAKNKAIVRMQSGEERYVHLKASATIGVVSAPDHQNESFGKAGRSRWRGIRPTVRGVAMNACDHPHGGGRGKSKGNVTSRSIWGVLAKRYKTRRGKHQNPNKLKDRPRYKEQRK